MAESPRTVEETSRIQPPDIRKAPPEDARELLERIKSYLSASVANPRTARDRENPAALMEALRELRRTRGN